MAKTAFIAGITGQDGAYLARSLVDKGYEVHGGVRRLGVVGTGRLEQLNVLDQIDLHYFEMLEMTNVQRVLDRVAPDEVYNLAGQSFVSASFEQPVYTNDVNALGPMRVLECLRMSGSRARFYQASSSEMFGKTRTSLQDERTPFHPRSPYGVSKLAAHWGTVNYRESFGLHACSGILFNHESPLRGTEFVTRKITIHLAEIVTGKRECIELGNLDAQRDWGFAGDYVEGIWRMLQHDKADDFVLATGQNHSVRDFIEIVARYHGWDLVWSGSGPDEVGSDRKTGKVIVRVDPKLYRPAEVDRLCGNAAKAERELGWRPNTSFEKLVEMMAEHDRLSVGGSAKPFLH